MVEVTVTSACSSHRVGELAARGLNFWLVGTEFYKIHIDTRFHVINSAIEGPSASRVLPHILMYRRIVVVCQSDEGSG